MVLYQVRYNQGMSVSAMIRDARHRAGLSQAELALKAGTSQPTLAGYESGRLLPRLDTLTRILESTGHELVFQAVPKVRRGAVSMAEVSNEIREIFPAEGDAGAWRRLLDFVDDFRGSPTAGKGWLVEEAPPRCGDMRFDAAMAAFAEQLCLEAGIAAPDWVAEPGRSVEPWWFVSGLRGFDAMALRDSPIAFARHGVFVNAGALDRV
jgi:transcriptional regulator with XRE-family HTH domain